MSLEHAARRIADVVQAICDEHYGMESQRQQERIDVPWCMLVQLAKAVVLVAEQDNAVPEALDEAAFHRLAEIALQQPLDEAYNLKFHQVIATSSWLNVWNLTYLELITRNDRAGKPPFGRWTGLTPWLKVK